MHCSPRTCWPSFSLVTLALGACLTSLSGCYAAVGPTVGIDLKSGRATVGVEASGLTFTVAHSVALGSKPAEPKTVQVHTVDPLSAARSVQTVGIVQNEYWRSRTYLLWEPGIPIPAGNTDGAFRWGALGGSVGVSFDAYDDAPWRAKVAGGAWVGVGQALQGRPANAECRTRDVRPYLALIVGIRGSEVYLSPKLGVLEIPRICLDSLFGDDGFD